MRRQSATVCLIKSPSHQHRALAGLPQRLATLADPRHRRGKRHPFVSVLLTACCTVLAGARSFAAIGQWAKNAPQEALARLGARTTSVFAVRIAPSVATVRRMLNTICPEGSPTCSVLPQPGRTPWLDGKSARGSRTADVPAAHLLAAMTGTAMTVAQLRVPDKTNEITCFAALLEPYDLAGVTVTADALHTQRAHARFLVEDKKAHYAFTMKKNQSGLYAKLKELPWDQARAKSYDRSEGHGRHQARVARSRRSSVTGPALGLANAPARRSTSSPT